MLLTSAALPAAQMGPPRANPRSTDSGSNRIAVGANPASLGLDEDGGFAEHNKLRQLQRGAWVQIADPGRCELPYFTGAIRSTLGSINADQASLYDGAGGEVLQSLVEGASELEVEGLSVAFGYLKELDSENTPPDVVLPCAGFWSVVSDSSAEKQIVCPPEAGTAVRYEVVSKRPKDYMKDVTFRFRAPGDEPLYVQLSVKCAGNDVAALLGCSNSSTLLDVQIGELAPQSGTFMPRVMKGTWRFARLSVTDLNPLFNPFKWMPPPLAVDTAAAPELDEEEAIAGVYQRLLDPFCHVMYRGKKPKLIAKFHITAITKKAVRKASGPGENDSITYWLECKEQDGTVTEVPINFDSLCHCGRSFASAFDSVNSRLMCGEAMKEGSLRNLLIHLDSGNVKTVTAPSNFGEQPCGDFFLENWVLPADGSAAVRPWERDLFVDKEYMAKKYSLYEDGYPSMINIPDPLPRFAIFRITADVFDKVFKKNEYQAWTTFSYGVCSLHYIQWQSRGSYATLFATGPKDCGKTTSAELVRKMTGVRGRAFRSDVTAAKLAQVCDRFCNLPIVVDDITKPSIDALMIDHSRGVANRSARDNMAFYWKPNSPVLFTVRG